MGMPYGIKPVENPYGVKPIENPYGVKPVENPYGVNTPVKNPYGVKGTTKGSKAPERSYKLKERHRFGLAQYGYITKDGRKIPDEYLVKITSLRNNCTIIAPLQEDIVMRVESRWDPFIPTQMLSMGNVLTQAFTGLFGKERRSLVTRATSRRIWQGSTPLSLSLKLRFEAIDDVVNEVLLPGKLLQAMALPHDPSAKTPESQQLRGIYEKKGTSGVLSALPVLEPPGPTPYSLKGILSGPKSYPTMTEEEVTSSMSRGGDFIMIEVGRFLTFYNVIVREDTLAYKIKFTREGNPIEADANIIFETYEMMTAEGLDNAYEKYTATKSVGG